MTDRALPPPCPVPVTAAPPAYVVTGGRVVLDILPVAGLMSGKPLQLTRELRLADERGMPLLGVELPAELAEAALEAVEHLALLQRGEQ